MYKGKIEFCIPSPNFVLSKSIKLRPEDVPMALRFVKVVLLYARTS